MPEQPEWPKQLEQPERPEKSEQPISFNTSGNRPSDDGPQTPANEPRRPVARSAFGLLTRLRDEAQRFPVVVALTACGSALTLLFIFDILDYGTFNGFFDDLRMSCFLGACVALTVQLAAERMDKASQRTWSLQLAGGLAMAAVSMITCWAGSATSRVELFDLWRFGLAGASLCLVPWLLMDEDNQDRLLPKLTSAALLAAGLSLVLCVGLCICVLAAEVLLFAHGGVINRLYEVALVVCGLFLAPNLLCAQLPHRRDELRVSRAYHALVGYVIFPLCLLLLLVLYGYIGKVVVTWSMPSGEMNWFGSFSLLVWAFLWMELRDVAWPPARWFVRWGWALLVPVVAVQLVGVAIRLRAYGLTELRWASLACTGLGIYALVRSALGRGPRTVFVAMAAVALALTIAPTNVIDAANFSQTHRLHQALAEAELIGEDGLVVVNPQGAEASPDQMRRAASAWDYLRWADRGYFGDRLVEDLRERMGNQSFNGFFGLPIDEGESGSHYASFVFNTDAVGLDVTGFARAYDLDTADSASSNSTVTSKDWTLHVAWDDGTELAVNLADTVAGLMSFETQAQEQGQDLHYGGELITSAKLLRVPCDGGRVLVLTRAYVDTEDGAVTEATLSGYLLVP